MYSLCVLLCSCSRIFSLSFSYLFRFLEFGNVLGWLVCNYSLFMTLLKFLLEFIFQLCPFSLFQQARLISLFFDTKKYQEALSLGKSFLKNIICILSDSIACQSSYLILLWKLILSCAKFFFFFIRNPAIIIVNFDIDI